MIDLVSQAEVQMPCGWLLNEDQMANSIWWVLVILQFSDAQNLMKSRDIIATMKFWYWKPIALISIIEGQF